MFAKAKTHNLIRAHKEVGGFRYSPKRKLCDNNGLYTKFTER